MCWTIPPSAQERTKQQTEEQQTEQKTNRLCLGLAGGCIPPPLPTLLPRQTEQNRQLGWNRLTGDLGIQTVVETGDWTDKLHRLYYDIIIIIHCSPLNLNQTDGGLPFPTFLPELTCYYPDRLLIPDGTLNNRRRSSDDDWFGVCFPVPDVDPTTDG